MTEQKRPPRCETCPFWERIKSYGGTPRPYGWCRYDPPVIAQHPAPGTKFDEQPVAHGNAWCRHHPDAPRIVTVREAARHLTNPLGGMMATEWREWTEVEREDDDAE